MVLDEPFDRSAAYLKHRSRELLVHVANELRLGRHLGRTPHQLRAWDREYRRYHGTAPERRGRWHRWRTDLRDARIGPLPVPDHLILGWGDARKAPRLYQEKLGYNTGMGYELMWRTVGYQWDVADSSAQLRKTWFTLTVNADGAAEFRAPSHRDAGDPDGVFRADPAGWRALMNHVSDSIARVDPLHPRKPIRLWQYPYNGGVDSQWQDVR